MTPKQFAAHLLEIDKRILKDGITFESVVRGYCLVVISNPHWSELALLLLTSNRGKTMLWAEEVVRENQPKSVNNHL